MSERELFNGSVARISHSASVLVNPNGRVALAEQTRNGKLTLPKGGSEIQDAATAIFNGTTAAEETALREIKEEVGVRTGSIQAFRSLGVAVRSSVGRGVDHHVEYFAGLVHKTRSQGLRPTAPQSEILSADFYDLEEALQALKNPTDQAVLQIGHAAICDEFKINPGRSGV